jgi:hypothetical protein
MRAVMQQLAIFVRHIETPAGARREEPPGAVLPCGHRVGAAGESACGACGNQIAGALLRRRGRGRRRTRDDGEMHAGVEDAQRLVMGDVLLRLRRVEIRQAKMGRVGHDAMS